MKLTDVTFSRIFVIFFFQESGQYLTVLIVLRRAVKILSGFGLSMNGQHVFCGDFIFSGHTMIFLLCYLVIIECKNSLFFCKIFNDKCFFFCEKWFHEFFALFFRYFQKTLHITLAGMDKCHHWCYSFTHGSRSLLHWCNFGLLDHNSTLVRDFMKKTLIFPHSTFYVISQIIFN